MLFFARRFGLAAWLTRLGPHRRMGELRVLRAASRRPHWDGSWGARFIDRSAAGAPGFSYIEATATSKLCDLRRKHLPVKFPCRLLQLGLPAPDGRRPDFDARPRGRFVMPMPSNERHPRASCISRGRSGRNVRHRFRVCADGTRARWKGPRCVQREMGQGAIVPPESGRVGRPRLP